MRWIIESTPQPFETTNNYYKSSETEIEYQFISLLAVIVKQDNHNSYNSLNAIFIEHNRRIICYCTQED